VPLLGAPTLAIDLPGRAGKMPEKALRELTLADSVNSIVSDVEAADLERVVLVGHSMAGLSIPGAAVRLGSRVEQLVFVAAVTPREGVSMIGMQPQPLRGFLQRRFSREMGKPDGSLTLPRWMARRSFCNDMGPADTAFVLDRLVPDAPGVGLEPASRAGLSDALPRSYIKMKRDKAVPPKLADQYISILGGGTRVVELDAGHDVMVSNPAAIAEAIRQVSTL
jgi:pimeloyl-ACP methyl ester carboxylesterase